MKIAIIGGSGFVGTCLIDLLNQATNYELINIDKNPSEKYSEITRIGNVMDKDKLTSQLKTLILLYCWRLSTEMM